MLASDKTTRVWDPRFATMTPKQILEDVCERRLTGFSTMTWDEMSLAGYPESEPLIDVCAAVADARP
jgi:hypothetical protein